MKIILSINLVLSKKQDMFFRLLLICTFSDCLKDPRAACNVAISDDGGG